MHTATGFIVTAVEGLAAEHYRRVISEKTRDALAWLRAKGRRVSRWAPYGFKIGPGGRLLAHRPETLTLQRIGRLAEAGLSLRSISRVLTSSLDHSDQQSSLERIGESRRSGRS